MVAAYKANLLDTSDPTTPAAVAQGHRLAWVAAGCVLAAMALRVVSSMLLDQRCAVAGGIWRSAQPREARDAGRHRRGWPWWRLAFGAPHAVAHDWSGFIKGAPTKSGKAICARA